MTYFDECRLKIFYWKCAMQRRLDEFAAMAKAYQDDLECHVKDQEPCTRRFCLQLHKKDLVPYDKR